MKIFAVSFLLVGVTIPSCLAGCKSTEELDACAFEISFLQNRDIKVPNNDGEVVAMCNKGKSGLACLKEGIACLPDPVKAISTKVMSDMERHMNTHCDSAPHRANFLKHVQCFQDGAKADAVRLCADRHVLMLEKASNLPKALRQGGACCSAHGFHKCVLDEITKSCPGETGDYFQDMIQEVTEENVELVCGDFTGLDKCDAKLDPAAWTDLKGILNSQDAAMLRSHKYKTVIPIIMKMIKEM